MNLFDSTDDELTRAVKEGRMNIAVVGFGYIGMCIGASIANTGNRVIGFDVNPEVIKKTNCGECRVSEPGLAELLRMNVDEKRLLATSNISELKGSDIIIITVGTPLDSRCVPDMSHIKEAAQMISEVVVKGQIIILKSTVPPLTTTDVVRPLLERNGLRAGVDFGLGFCPERLAEGNALNELKAIPVVVGGVNEKSTRVIATVWRALFPVETIPVSSPAAAEMSKLADNLWIDLNIALANEIAMLSERLGINAMEVIRAANSLPKGKSNVNILYPSMGVGGYCLTKDPWFLYALGKENGIEMKTPRVSREINERMPIYTFNLIEETLLSKGKKLTDSKVAVFGLSFKNNTGDLRNTPTVITIKMLLESGCEVKVFDPLVDKEEARRLTRAEVVTSWNDAVRDADCIAFFTFHDRFREIPFELLSSLTKGDCFILDGRNGLDLDLRTRAGLQYKGIGV